jgi:hypothetical protein
VLAANSAVHASVTPAADAAGNPGVPATADHGYTVDVVAPTVVITTDVNNDGVLNSGETNAGANPVAATVTLDPALITAGGSGSIKVTDNGVVTTLTVHADGSVTGGANGVTGSYNGTTGVVTLALPEPGNGNTVTVQATQTSVIGNVSLPGSDSALEDLHVPSLSLTLSNPAVPTISDGLIRDTWNAAVGAYNGGSGVAPTTMETAIDGWVNSGAAVASSTVLTNAAVASVTAGIASLTHGLIYLNAGTTYTFSGKSDDSFLLEIGGKVVASATWGGSSGNFSGTLKPTVSGWYTTEIYHDNENGPGNFSVQVSVNGATAVNMDTSHFQLVQSVQDLNANGVRTAGLQGSTAGEPNDGYFVALPNNEGHDGQWIPLSAVAASITNAGPNDAITSVQLTHLNASTQVSDGMHWATAGSNGIVDITGWTMSSLEVLAPSGFTGTMNAVVQVTATDSFNGAASTSTQALSILVDPYTTVGGATGTGTDDVLTGAPANLVLNGGAGNDLINVGLGNETLTGGAGSDVFRWLPTAHGTAGTPLQDTITDWSNALPSKGGDILDLRDLLVGESHGAAALGNLTNFIHFEKSGANTIVDISTTGGFSAGFSAGATDLKVVMQNTDLTNGGTLASDAQIIHDLISKGKLHTD